MKTVKHHFSNKFGGSERIIEEDKVVPEHKQVAATFESRFETLVKNLGIKSKFMSEMPVRNESVTDIINKFQNHPSVTKTRF